MNPYLSKKNEIISILVDRYGCSFLRDGEDLDFGLLDSYNRNNIFQFLIEEGFVNTYLDNTTMNFKKFIDHKLIDIDIDETINSRHLKRYFYNLKIKEDFWLEYFRNPSKNQIAMKCIRYILLLRGNQQKYISFFLENKKIIIENNFFLNKLNNSPFRKKVSYETILDIVKSKKKALILNIKPKYLLYFIWVLFKKNFIEKRGKIVSIEGVDGAGKSTIINILSKELNAPYYYMGEKNFYFDNFYNKKTTILNYIWKTFGKTIEKYYRYLVVYRLSKNNQLVFTDRYHTHIMPKPSNFTNLVKDYINKILLIIYPRADKSIVLWNDPQIILNRKQEVSKEFIDNFNNRMIIDYKDAVFIKNNDIDETLNTILKEVYS